VLPSELEQLAPSAVQRVTMPVLLPNGTVIKVQRFPVVDWTPLFMTSVAGAQALEAQMRWAAPRALTRARRRWRLQRLCAVRVCGRQQS
jgi:hypothetical protein